jgi:hypothetical protein
VRMRSLGMVRSSLAVLTVSTLFPGTARSEEQPGALGPIVVGSKVRFQAPTASQGPVQGTVMEMDSSSLLISTEKQRPFRVSRQAITQLEVAVGRRRNARKGLIIGTVAGAVLVGLVAGIPRDSFCPPAAPDPQSCRDTRKLFLTTGLPLVALEGAGVGALIKSDRWSSVPVAKVQMSLAPICGPGLGLALSLRF